MASAISCYKHVEPKPKAEPVLRREPVTHAMASNFGSQGEHLPSRVRGGFRGKGLQKKDKVLSEHWFAVLRKGYEHVCSSLSSCLRIRVAQLADEVRCFVESMKYYPLGLEMLWPVPKDVLLLVSAA